MLLFHQLDIYVYFKMKNGTWSKPINLGNDVNSNYTETCPSLTPDGKYLFFSRYNEEGGLSNIYWVSAKVINRLRPSESEIWSDLVPHSFHYTARGRIQSVETNVDIKPDH